MAEAQTDFSIDSLRSHLPGFLEETDSSKIAEVYYSIARELYNANRYFEAGTYLDSALLFAPIEQKAKTLNLRGIVAWFRGEYDNALNYYQRALKAAEIVGDKKFHAMALNNIGFIFSEYKKYDKTLDYYFQALEIRKDLRDKKGIGLSLNNIGRAYSQLDSLNKAIEYHQQGLQIFQEIGYLLGESNALNTLGNIHLHLGNFAEARQHHLKSLSIRKQINNTYLVSESHKNLAKDYLQTKDYQKVETHIQQGIEAALEIESQKSLKNLYYLQFELHTELNNHEKALSSYLNYNEINDNLLSEESENRIAELEIEYQLDKKENQIEILDQQNQLNEQRLKSRNYLLISALALILLFLFSAVFIIRQNKLKAELRLEQNRQKLLRSQMNPHFIYNSLSAIQNFILQNNPTESASYISEFAGLMRLVLEGSRTNLVPLKDDIRLANSYLKLQQLRFDHSFDFHIEVSAQINTDWHSVPPMLSQPFIENAVEHGMRYLPKNVGRILVKYELIDHEVQIIIEDNGGGSEQKESHKPGTHKSLAKKITRERIANLSKTQQLDIRMNISSETKSGGTRVEFLIPQKTIPE